MMTMSKNYYDFKFQPTAGNCNTKPTMLICTNDPNSHLNIYMTKESEKTKSSCDISIKPDEALKIRNALLEMYPTDKVVKRPEYYRNGKVVFRENSKPSLVAEFETWQDAEDYINLKTK